MNNLAVDKKCNEFEPQNYLQDRCKKCFRLKATHSEEQTKTSKFITQQGGKPVCSILKETRCIVEPSPMLNSEEPNIKKPFVIVNVNQQNDDISIKNNNVFKNINTTSSMSTSLVLSNSSPAKAGSTKSIFNTLNNNGTINTNISSSSTSLKSSSSFAKKERRRSWRDKALVTNCDEGPDFEDTTDSISLASYKTAHSRDVLSMKSTESVNSNFETRSMVTAMSEDSFDLNEIDDDRAITPTDATKFNSKWKNSLQKENARLQVQVLKLKEERQRWTLLKKSSIVSNNKCENNQNTIEMLEERLTEAENLLHDYREENSVLKCELQDIQENFVSHQKFDALKAVNNQLTSKNSELLQNIQDLQHEIEEMQDQFREEEIDEFRELQRELEQYAKNCRILQFKHRKSERQCEQLKSEKNFLTTKLCEFQEIAGTVNLSTNNGSYSSLNINNASNASNKAESHEKKINNDVRIRDLESELKVAKEVSIRLHNELEAAEDKRYKLEDEIFYFQEKVRELQTQNKWRETRNKVEKSIKRNSQELSNASLNSVETSKELRDVLERETDLRDQLKFTEEDLHRTQLRLKDVENENEELMNKLLSISEGNNIRSQKETISQLTKNQRLPILRSNSEGQEKIYKPGLNTEEMLQSTIVSSLLTNYRKYCKSLTNFENKDGMDTVQLEKDFILFLTNINKLEQKNSESQTQLQTVQILNSLPQFNLNRNENRGLIVELRKEQELRKELQNELTEYKQLIAKSDNNKLIAMASKVEELNNQLSLLNDRCQTLHQKSFKSENIDVSYADKLKSRCDHLENQLSALKANDTYKISHRKDMYNKEPSADDIEQCCALLASVDAQTSRISKQLEKIETGQKEERRRSLSKDNYSVVTADLANVMAELKVLHKVLNTHKILNVKTTAENKYGNSNSKELSTTYNLTQNEPDVKLSKSICKDCIVKNETIESQTQEISFYKKKSKELTNQVLQTEDRWTSEIEKQNTEHQAQIKKLENDLSRLQTLLLEQTQLADFHSVELKGKCKLIDETNIKHEKLIIEINEKLKIIESMEKEQKILKEWEIKYKTLESLYEKEKQRFYSDRTKMKSDTNILKKRTDEALFELTRLRDGHQRREILWNEERSKLEQEILQMKGNVNNSDQKCLNKDDNHVINIPICTASYRTAAVAAAAAETKIDNINTIKTNQLKQRVFVLEKKNEELEVLLQKAKAQKCDFEIELNKNKQVWDREKDDLTHKKRQDDKIRNVELNALQQKFSCRIDLMNASNKSLHSQLVQIRRERDQHRDVASTYEQKLKKEKALMVMEHNKYDSLLEKYSECEKKLVDALASIERLQTEITLLKEASNADKKLWAIDKEVKCSTQLVYPDGKEDRNYCIVENALSAAENVQKQYAEYQKFCNKEVNRLKDKIKELNEQLISKEDKFKKKAKELTEQIKILEIDQKNLTQVKDLQDDARQTMLADQERLKQIVQNVELHNITRRYKISSIIKQINCILEKHNGSTRNKNDCDVILLINVINQLNLLKEDDGTLQCPTAIGETLSEADTTAPSDTLSQSSISIRSIPHAENKNIFIDRHNGITYYGEMLTNGHGRSCSVESSTTWDSRLLDYTNRSVSPIKRTFHNDSNQKITCKRKEYGKNQQNSASSTIGTMPNNHYNKSANNVTNSHSCTPTNWNFRSMQNAGALISFDDTLSEFPDEITTHSRMSSTGTNVLYKIRREELAKNANLSVRSIAQAFESIGTSNDKKSPKSKHLSTCQLKSFFSMRKSRSVDHETKEDNNKILFQPKTLSNINYQSFTKQTQNSNDMVSSCSSTLPRGGRNLFKNMSSKIVERVRRSLSRNSRSEDNLEKSITSQLNSEKEGENNSMTKRNTETISENASNHQTKRNEESDLSKSEVSLQSNDLKRSQKTTLLTYDKISMPRTVTHIMKL